MLGIRYTISISDIGSNDPLGVFPARDVREVDSQTINYSVHLLWIRIVIQTEIVDIIRAGFRRWIELGL